MLLAVTAVAGCGGTDDAAPSVVASPAAPTTAGDPVGSGTTVATTVSPTSPTAILPSTVLAGSAPASAGPTTAMPAATTPSTATAPTSPADVTTTSTPAASGGTGTEPPTVRPGPDAFRFEIHRIDDAMRARMEPTSWRPGCPVGLEDLRYLRISHRDFSGQEHLGELVVHRDAVDAMFDVFAALWVARYPIRSMRLVDDFGGDDNTSIAADNTSAFNCRFVAGTTRWSNHATGRAIDINPIENPWVENGRTDHPASVPFIDRRPAPGVIIEGDAVTRAFDAVGWGWGGRWGEPLDYQHFSATGS